MRIKHNGCIYHHNYRFNNISFSSFIISATMIGELILRRANDETWYVAMMRIAKSYGLDKEVEDHYNRYITAGDPEATACFAALNDWDCLEGTDEQMNGESS